MSKSKQSEKKKNNDKSEIKKRIRAVSPARWIVLSVMLVITVLSYVFYGYLFAEDSWFTQPNTGVLFFDKAIGIVPVLAKCIQSVTILLLIVTVLALIVRKSFGKTQRGFEVCFQQDKFRRADRNHRKRQRSYLKKRQSCQYHLLSQRRAV